MRNTHPHLASEFDMEGNAPLTPDTIKAGTNKELHWICSECSHHWKSPGNNRTAPQSSGCPVCANKEVHEDGRNSLRNTHPELAKEFSVEKNYPITADMIVAGSNKKFHWICISCQHEWKAVANSRAGGRGCPACSGRAIHIDGRNSVSALAPKLAKEIHPDLNGSWNAENLTLGSDVLIWWICKEISEQPCGNIWKTRVAQRGVNSTGCPKCANFGFDPTVPAQYYVLRILNAEGDVLMYKAGKTNNHDRRIKEHIRIFKHHELSKLWTVEIEEIIRNDSGAYIQEIETKLLRQKEIRAPDIPDLSHELFISNPLDYARKRKWV